MPQTLQNLYPREVEFKEFVYNEHGLPAQPPSSQPQSPTAQPCVVTEVQPQPATITSHASQSEPKTGEVITSIQIPQGESSQSHQQERSQSSSPEPRSRSSSGSSIQPDQPIDISPRRPQAQQQDGHLGIPDLPELQGDEGDSGPLPGIPPRRSTLLRRPTLYRPPRTQPQPSIGGGNTQQSSLQRMSQPSIRLVEQDPEDSHPPPEASSGASSSGSSETLRPAMYATHSNNPLNGDFTEEGGPATSPNIGLPPQIYGEEEQSDESIHDHLAQLPNGV